MPEITLIEAVTQALAYELAHDDNVVVFGEDVGKNGGVFRATVGLQERFGEARVMDTPLADRFIGMYVNHFTLDYGEIGRRAIREFLGEAHKAGLIPAPVELEFVS